MLTQRRKRIVAWCFLGIGIVVLAVGVAVVLRDRTATQEEVSTHHLIIQLKSPGTSAAEITNRVRACFSLAQLGPKAQEAVPELMKALHDPVAQVRRRAVYALGRIGPAAAPACPVL